MTRLSIYTLSIVLILSLILTATAIAVNDPGIEAKVDSFLGPVLQLDLISGSVLIADKGEIVFSKGYGPANREYDIPNEIDTKFRIGSMTKQFTAAAIMLLEERNLLSVNDPISKYYPEFPRADEITLHHLLTHTSGIINYNNLKDYHEKQMLPLSIDEVIDLFKDEPLQFDPGQKFSYSNSGYVILAGIIEKASALSYAEFLKENIFDPLGMKNTGQDVHHKILKKRADGYVCFGEEIIGTLYRDMPFTSGAGSIYSTIEDLFLWDRALYSDKLLSTESRQKMFTPGEGQYGYGWFIDEKYGRKLISHEGAINGFMCNIDRLVDDNILVVVLLNYQSTFYRQALRGITAIALGEEYEPLLVDTPLEVSAEKLNSYAGKYQLNVGVAFEARVKDNQLTIVDDEGAEYECQAQSETKFFVKDMNAIVAFRPDQEGNFNQMIILQGAGYFRGSKI